MKTFVVAEIGSNWEGDLTKAKKIIRNCKKAGADGVKFQIWRANDLYKESHPNWNQIKKSEITFDVLEKCNFNSEDGIPTWPECAGKCIVHNFGIRNKYFF